MKTSNKILLGVFLTGLFIITALHIAIYAKYKAGAIIQMENPVVEKFDFHSLPQNARYVVIKNIQGILVGMSDSAHISVAKEISKHIHYSMQGDTLVVNGDSAFHAHNRVEGFAPPLVMVDLPSPGKIIAVNSNISLRTGPVKTAAPAYDVEITNTSLYVDQTKVPEGPLYISKLTVNATTSGLYIAPFIEMNELNVTLNNSVLQDGNSRLHKITLTLDDSSGVGLQGKNLKNANLITNGSN